MSAIPVVTPKRHGSPAGCPRSHRPSSPSRCSARVTAATTRESGRPPPARRHGSPHAPEQTRSGGRVLNVRAGATRAAGSRAMGRSAGWSCFARGSRQGVREASPRHLCHRPDGLRRAGVRLRRLGVDEHSGAGGRAPPGRGPRRERGHRGRLRLPHRLRGSLAHVRGAPVALRAAVPAAVRPRAGVGEQPPGPGPSAGPSRRTARLAGAPTALIADLAEGLLAGEGPGPAGAVTGASTRSDQARPAIPSTRATRVVHSSGLEAITGPSRATTWPASSASLFGTSARTGTC